VLLLIEHDRNRELLGDWLATFARYRVTTATRSGELPEAFDLCILDEASLSTFRSALETRVERAAPVFLPVLLVSSRSPGTSSSGTPKLPDDPLVDDVVTMPVKKAILRRRTENLLQARRSSLELVAQQDQYRRLVELTPETILLVEDAEVVYANEAAIELLGAPDAAAIEGTSILSYVADDAAALESLLATVRTDGHSDSFVDLDLEAVDGTVVSAEIAGVTVTYEDRPVSQLVVRDVTSQKRTQQRIDLFRRAIEAASQGITIADARQDDLPLVYANDAFQRITGYDIDDVLGLNCRFLQGEHTDPETVTEIRRGIEDERPVSVELLNYRKDGTPFWNRLDIVPVENEAGEVTHFLGLQRDVTARKEREQRLSVLDRTLRHNLRNRLTVIRGQAERIRDGEKQPREAAEHVIDAADRLLNISDQVRDFRGIVAAEDRQLGTFDLAETLSTLVDDFRTAHPEATVTLSTPETVPVRAHETLPGAIEELLSMTADAERISLHITVDTDDEAVLVDVVDESGTLSPTDLAVIDRGMESPLDHPRGLELWLIRWAVEYSHGELTVESDAEPPLVRMRFWRPDAERDPTA
jgi:PAS domain S-box-containing protein